MTTPLVQQIETWLGTFGDDIPPMAYRKMVAIQTAAAEALAGRHGHAAACDELSTREVMVPCDCGCGRQCCAACGCELGFIQEATPSRAGGGEVGEWTKDAENWGNALNEASWKFVEVCPEKSALLFNHCKTALREAILLYANRVSALHGAGARGGENG